MTSDADLLRAFAGSRDEPAFAALVQRHLGLVHSAALRLTRDPHLAEDVTQAVFVALARQATEVSRKVVDGMPLSAWLHTTTRNLAAKAIRTEARRRNRERLVGSMNDPASESPADLAEWERVAPHLDESLAQLSESDRNVVLLRFFESQTAREIADRLGIGEEAAQKRVSRAMERLRALLAERVPHLSSATLVAVLTAFAIGEAPVTLAATVSRNALAGALAVAPTGFKAWLGQCVPDLVMTKTQILITAAVVTAFAIPLGARHAEYQRLQTALVATPSPITAPAEPDSGASAVAAEARSDPDEAAEIARLNRRAEELRRRIAAKAARVTARPAEPDVANAGGPVLLTRGRPVALSNLVVAGSATVEAALQTSLALGRDGDLDGALSLMLLSAAETAEWLEVRDDPAQRAELAHHLESEFSDVLAVELVGVEPIAERRNVVTLKRIRPAETNMVSITFGRVASGWKRLP